MAKPTIELIHELLQKISTINLNDASTILGGTSTAGSTLNELRSSASALQEAVAEGQPYETVMKHYEVLAGAVDTAGITGLISETEMTEYYTLIDAIWAAIEKEKEK